MVIENAILAVKESIGEGETIAAPLKEAGSSRPWWCR